MPRGSRTLGLEQKDCVHQRIFSSGLSESLLDDPWKCGKYWERLDDHLVEIEPDSQSQRRTMVDSFIQPFRSEVGIVKEFFAVLKAYMTHYISGESVTSMIESNDRVRVFQVFKSSCEFPHNFGKYRPQPWNARTWEKWFKRLPSTTVQIMRGRE